MSDQCRHCTLRGDIERCRAADCGHHANWYALEQQAEIERLRETLKAIKPAIDGLIDYLEFPKNIRSASRIIEAIDVALTQKGG